MAADNGDVIPSTLTHSGAVRFWLAVLLTGIGTGVAAVVLTRLLEMVQQFMWNGPGTNLLDATERASAWRHILVLLGAGLLWFGWYGFNAGSEFRVDSVTAVAFLNTDISASFAAIAWLAMDWITSKKPKFLGLLTGAVAGLATITPAAGYVSPSTACLIGVIEGVVCFYAVALKNKLGWDDALDVWGVHGVGGFLGIVLLGVFATTRFNPNSVNGLLNGNPRFFFIELGAVAISSLWAFVFTLGMLWAINKVTPVRVEDATEEMGLDEGLHGERAYLEDDAT